MIGKLLAEVFVKMQEECYRIEELERLSGRKLSHYEINQCSNMGKYMRRENETKDSKENILP